MKRRKVLWKKEKGMSGTMDFLPMILLIVFGAYVLISCGLQIRYLDTLNRLENLSRKYLMIMETTNGLTTVELNQFYKDLEEMGIPASDVDFEGTTFWDGNVEYGEEIYLNFKAKVPYHLFSISEDFRLRKTCFKKEVKIRKCALALA